jgi:Zn-dependent protease
MKGSWKLGEVAGIGVFVHWSFLILPILIAWPALANGAVAAALSSVLFVLAVFGCVALHELGHALAARRYGIDTLDITLLPIGGLARLERMPRKPIQELVIALAGPAVNVAIAAAIFAGLHLAGGIRAMLVSANIVASPFLVQLMWANVALVLFNLLPAFPMDGGRVLRALLALRMPYLRATEIAAGIGQALAIVLGIIGFSAGGMQMLMLVALFVFLAARSELQMVRARTMAEQRMRGSFQSPVTPIIVVPDQIIAAEIVPDYPTPGPHDTYRAL